MAIVTTEVEYLKNAASWAQSDHKTLIENYNQYVDWYHSQ